MVCEVTRQSWSLHVQQLGQLAVSFAHSGGPTNFEIPGNC
jgi:hypothetical protein